MKYMPAAATGAPRAARPGRRQARQAAAGRRRRRVPSSRATSARPRAWRRSRGPGFRRRAARRRRRGAGGFGDRAEELGRELARAVAEAARQDLLDNGQPALMAIVARGVMRSALHAGGGPRQRFPARAAAQQAGKPVRADADDGPSIAVGRGEDHDDQVAALQAAATGTSCQRASRPSTTWSRPAHCATWAVGKQRRQPEAQASQGSAPRAREEGFHQKLRRKAARSGRGGGSGRRWRRGSASRPEGEGECQGKDQPVSTGRSTHGVVGVGGSGGRGKGRRGDCWTRHAAASIRRCRWKAWRGR